MKPSSKQSKSPLLVLVISIVAICMLCAILWFFGSPTSLQDSNRSQILESYGFRYSMVDGNGDPTYVSPCGSIVTLKASYTGFAARYDPSNLCPMQEMGTAISALYPPEVFDFIVDNMNSVIVGDSVIHKSVKGYDIIIDFSRTEFMLLITISN